MTPGDRQPPAKKLAVIVNGERVKLPPWACWRDAVTAWRPAVAIRITRGEAWIADARGEPLDPGGAVVEGGEIRVQDRTS